MYQYTTNGYGFIEGFNFIASRTYAPTSFK
jgi:hypothetical protein